MAIAWAILMAAAALGDGDGLVVHEWGTFTVLQDETGRALPGVNVNEESLPPFVYRLDPGLVPDAHGYSAALGEGPYSSYASKGIPRIFPAALLRMETPVIYFYPPDDRPLRLDVEVKFRQGWISEWYPAAEVDAPGFHVRTPEGTAVGSIGRQTVGSIRWKGLTVAPAAWRLPETDEHAWQAPRKVKSAVVAVPRGECEKYLFYRGVADLPAPIRVRRLKCGNLGIFSDFPGPARIRGAFLVDIRGGRVAFRRLGALEGAPGATLAVTAPEWGAGDESGIDGLRAALREALVADGLYAEEAEALLETWKHSYFELEGLRLFFTVPQAWTDAVLPLKLSRPAQVRRVFVGRVELVEPSQRALLDAIASGPASDRSWFRDGLAALAEKDRARALDQIRKGQCTPESLGMKVPADYRAYLALGRFRDALVLDAARDPGRPGLSDFARAYQLRYFQPSTARGR